MWAIALGLDLADRWVKNGTEPEICKDQPGELVTLDQFNYTNKKMGCLMREGFAATKFTGITVSSLSTNLLLQAFFPCRCQDFNE